MKIAYSQDMGPGFSAEEFARRKPFAGCWWFAPLYHGRIENGWQPKADRRKWAAACRMWAAPAACLKFAGPILSGEMVRRAWVGWQGGVIGSHARADRWLQMAWAVPSLSRIHRRAAVRASP